MGVVTAAEFFGNAIRQSITANFTLDYRARFWVISADAGRTVFYPPVTQSHLPVGIHVFAIANVGANSFTARDTELVELSLSVAQNKMVILSTVLDSNGAKRWCIDYNRTFSSY